MKEEQLRAQMEADAAAIINELMGTVTDRDMNLTEIEEVALKARAAFGQQLAARMVEMQVARNRHELPVGVTGKPMQNKGKKRGRSAPESGT